MNETRAINKIPPTELNNLLTNFVVKLRKQNGEDLSLIHSPRFSAVLIVFYKNRVHATAYWLTYSSRRPGRLFQAKENNSVALEKARNQTKLLLDSPTTHKSSSCCTRNGWETIHLNRLCEQSGFWTPSTLAGELETTIAVKSLVIFK